MGDAVINNIQSSSDEELDEVKPKIACYDNRLLTDVCQHVSREVQSFVHEHMSPELAEKFTSRFAELYESVIRENVSVRELSSEAYSQQTNSEKRKSKSKMVNENLLPKLGELLVELLEKRKRYPYHCCQILHQKFKQDRKHLKESPQFNLIDEKHNFTWDEKNNELLYAEQGLDSGFQLLNSFIVQVENEIHKVKKLEEDTRSAQVIYQREKQNILSIFCDSNKNNEPKFTKQTRLAPALLGER